MGRFLRKNTFIICYFIIIILMLFISIKNVKDIFPKQSSLYRVNDTKYQEVCNIYLNSDTLTKEQLVKQNNWLTLNDKYCNAVVKKDSKSISVYLVYTWFIESGLFNPITIPLILLIPIVYLISKEFKSETIKNYLLRDNYKKYVFRLFAKSYKFIFIIPIIMVIFYIVSLNLSEFNYNYLMDMGLNHLSIDAPVESKTFFITYLIIILLNMGIYANIGLTILRKNKNFFTALVESFIVVNLFWLISFVFIGIFVQKITGIWAESINVMEIYTWNMVTDEKLFLIVNVIYYLISLFIALLAYRNKEKLIIMCER